MRSISKKIITIAILMMIILSGLNVVNAANIPVRLTSNSKIVEGETVTIDINVDNQVYGISATLSYDTDVFESATISSTVANSADLSNNVIVIESGNIMPKGIIGTITLKVKKNISKTEGKVSLSEGKATDETISSQILTGTSIIIKKDNTNQNPGQDGNNNPGTNNQGTNNQGTNNSGTNNPGTNNPSTSNPGTNNQGTNNSGTNNSGTNNQDTNNSGVNKPGANKPSNNKDTTLISSNKLPQAGEPLKIGFWITITGLMIIAIYCKIKANMK